MEGISVPYRFSEGMKICELATKSLGQPIPIGGFRTLMKASALFRFQGAGDIDKIAYQLVELMEARGITDPKRMNDTIDIAYKAYNGSNGRVTPKDLNVAVRQSRFGRKISDDDLLTLAAAISIQKRNRGE
jgi:hypothetical protein